MIKILLADDSPFVREQLRQIFRNHNDIVVVGEARNGKECVLLNAQLSPNLIIMDVDMPIMDGIEATRIIMEEIPVPIVIHTSSYISKSRNVPFEAIKMGAIDIIEKTKMDLMTPQKEKEFVNRIRLIAGIKVFRRFKVKHEIHPSQTESLSQDMLPPSVLTIAASTGGPKVIFDIFTQLPPFLPFPTLVVQHIGATFVQGFIEWLQTTTQVQMKIAEHGETLLPNVCYVSPGDVHLAVQVPNQIALLDTPPVHSCKPSADVLFSSISKVYGNTAIGVLLTGIGEDGAFGLYDLRQAGGITIAQDKDSSIVYGMPKKAIEMNAASFVGNVQQITDRIKKLFHLQ